MPNDPLHGAASGASSTQNDCRTSRNALHRYLDSTGMLAVILDTDGLILFVNRKGIETLGLPEPEITGRVWTDRFLPDSEKPSFAQMFRRAIDGESENSGLWESPIRTQSGRERIFGWRCTPIRGDSGRVECVVLSGEDAAERPAGMDALKKKVEFLRAIVDSLPDALYIKDDQARTILANRSDFRFMGAMDETDVLGKTDFEVYPKERAEAFYADDQSVLQTGEPITNREERFRDSEGNEIILLTTKIPLFDRTGRICGLLGIGRDITEWRRAETALQFTQFAVDHSAEAAIWMNPEGRLVYVNESACHSLGYSREELLGLSLHDIDSDFSEERWPDHWRDVKQRRHFILESRHRRKDGTVFPVEIQVNFVEFGGSEYNCAFVRDISERRELEARIQADIREKEVMLKEIHHRVKNNMQVISSLLHLQASSVKDEPSRQMFRESQLRIRSMAMVHEQLYQTKNFARIEFGRYVENLTKELMYTFGVRARGVELKTDIPSLMLDVNTAIPCGLIVNELVTNSLKHAFPEGPKKEDAARSGGQKRIMIRTGPAGKNGFWKLTVEDNGIGIPGGLDIRATESLGMKIVTALVDQMGGTIEVDGRKGTAFSFTFRMDSSGET